MAEYIDKADLVKRLESRVKDYGRDCNINAPIISRTYQEVLHMVENLPTADVIPVCLKAVYDPNKAKAGLLWKEVNSKYAK